MIIFNLVSMRQFCFKVILLFFLAIPYLVFSQGYQPYFNRLIDGERALNNGKIDEAIDAFTQAVNQNRWYAPANYDLGLAYMKKGNRMAALSWMKAALDLDPKYALAYETRAVYMRDTIFDAVQALADIKKAIKYGQSKDVPYYYLDQATIYLMDNKSYDKVIESLDYTIEKVPYLAVAYGLRGEAKRNRNDNDISVMEDLSKALSLDPKCIPANFAVGMLALKKKEPYNAITFFTRALDERPDLVDVRYERGIAYSMQRDYKSALEDYRILTIRNPQNYAGWDGLAHFYYLVGEYQNAVDAYSRAIDLAPSYGECYTQIIIPLSRLEKFNEAAKFFREYKQRGLSTNIEEHHWTFYDRYAKVITEDIPEGNFSMALNDINMAIYLYEQQVTDKTEYTFGEGAALKGYILEKLGRQEEALTAYHKALLEPETQPDVVRAVERIERPIPQLQVTRPFIIPAKAGPKRYHAILIAENTYEDRNFISLPHPIAELTAFKNVLINNYGFLPADVKFLPNANREEILTQIENVCSKLDKDDDLIIYYAGHGSAQTNRTGNTDIFWVPTSAKWQITASFVAYNDVLSRISQGNPRHVVVIADACSSGAGTRGIGKITPKSISMIDEHFSRHLMTSGQGDVPDASLLAYYLRVALQDNKEEFVSMQALFDGFRSTILDSVNYGSYPEYRIIPNVGDEGGDFIFRRSH